MICELQGAIFDFDGVLGNSIHLHFSYMKLFYPTVTLKQYKKLFLGNYWKEFEKANLSTTLSEQQQKRIHLKYKEEQQMIPLFDGVAGWIARIGKHHPIAINTSAEDHSILPCLRTNNIESYFRTVATKKDNVCKVEKFGNIVKKNNLIVAKTLFVTDSLGDINDARKFNRNMKVAAVTYGIHDEKTLRKGKPDYIFHTPDKLFNHIWLHLP